MGKSVEFRKQYETLSAHHRFRCLPGNLPVERRCWTQNARHAVVVAAALGLLEALNIGVRPPLRRIARIAPPPGSLAPPLVLAAAHRPARALPLTQAWRRREPVAADGARLGLDAGRSAHARKCATSRRRSDRPDQHVLAGIGESVAEGDRVLIGGEEPRRRFPPPDPPEAIATGSGPEAKAGAGRDWCVQFPKIRTVLAVDGRRESGTLLGSGASGRPESGNRSRPGGGVGGDVLWVSYPRLHDRHKRGRLLRCAPTVTDRCTPDGRTAFRSDRAPGKPQNGIRQRPVRGLKTSGCAGFERDASVRQRRSGRSVGVPFRVRPRVAAEQNSQADCKASGCWTAGLATGAT